MAMPVPKPIRPAAIIAGVVLASALGAAAVVAVSRNRATVTPALPVAEPSATARHPVSAA